MSDSPRYIIAKYAPDVARYEPRNIGVVLQGESFATCKFLKIADAHFVHRRDHNHYSRWIKFWKRSVDSGQVADRHGITHSVADNSFLQAFSETQRGKFFLHEGGYLLDEIHDTDDYEQATYFLFDELVKSQSKMRPKRTLLEKSCTQIFEQIGVAARVDFEQARKVSCQVENENIDFTCHYALGNGKVNTVMQRVALGKPQSVFSSAFMFDWLDKSSVIADKHNRIALVQGNGHERESSVLEAYATLLDVSDKSAASHLADLLGV